MTQSLGGVVPLDTMLAGIRAEVTFDHDPRGQTYTRLLNDVEQHAALEAQALGQYDHLAQASGDPVVALVMRLILDDEERHHTLLKRIASSLRDALNWTFTADALPRPRLGDSRTSAEDLTSLTRELIDEEKTGAQALRRLAVREKGVGGGLDSLLLEMMAMDSEKHARLLQFVQRRLEARSRAEHASHFRLAVDNLDHNRHLLERNARSVENVVERRAENRARRTTPAASGQTNEIWCTASGLLSRIG